MVTIKVSDMLTTQISLSGQPQLLSSQEVHEGRRSGRHHIEVYNSGSSDIYIGNAEVTTENGLPVPAKTGKIIPVTGEAELYATGTGSIILAEYFM